MSEEEKVSFTPGPWKITDFKDECTCAGVSVSDSKGNMVCDFDECHHFDRFECRANAMIIKEAPAMRSFLDRLLDWDRDFGTTSPLGLLVLADLIRDAQNLVKATESEQ